jgi:replication factor C subunit 1
MAFGDIIEKEIRTNNNWSLLPLQAAFSSVMPGNYMNGHLSHQIAFPAFMGKMSTTNKRNRLLNELKMHMNLKVSGSKTALNLDYLEPLRDSIIGPLIANGTGGVPEAIEKLENYCLRREDIESIIELTLWDNQTDPMSKVDPKTKAALTRAYNKEGFALPYALGTVKKGRKGNNSNDFDLEIDGEEPNDELNDNMEEDDDNDNIDLDAMIKAKKTSKKSPKKKTETQTKRKTSAKKSKKSEIEIEPKSKRKESKNSSKGKAIEKK